MTRYWPFWLGGLYLAMVPVIYWLLLHRMFAVSSRFTDINEWLSARLRRKPEADVAAAAQKDGLVHDLVFLASIAVGGSIAAGVAKHGVPRLHGPDPAFLSMFGDIPIVFIAVLFAGGAMVGFGTRMAGGCTSGHGLCGVSRFQPGSLLATACFFGAGIMMAFVLGAIWGPA